MELIGRILDGSITLGGPGLEPSPGSVSQDDKIERLEAVPLFASCTRRQLKSLARITDTFDAAAGTVVARAGEPGEEFFLIVDGQARVDASGRQVRLGPGQYFGEMSLLDGAPRSATVTAETPLRLLVIRRRDFAALLENSDALVRSLLVTLSRRVREVERALEETRQTG